MTVPRGGVGSNQYRTQPADPDPTSVAPRARTSALAAAVTADPDTEDVAWAFSPERAEWSAIGVTDRNEAAAWEALGMAASDVRWWVQSPFEFTADEAARWRRQGWLDPSMIDQHRESARALVEAGFTEDEAIGWQHNDMTFTVEQAVAWKSAGFDGYDAHDWRLHRSDITPTEAASADPDSNPFLGTWNAYGSTRPS